MWVKYLTPKPTLKNPVAIAASQGLRSVGKIAVEHLIKKLPCELIAEIRSPHFAVQYIGTSYLGTIGGTGVRVEKGLAYLPGIEVYASKTQGLIVVRGYQSEYDPGDPNAIQGPFLAASTTIEILQKLGVKKLFVLAGHGTKGKRIFCAATDQQLVEEMKKFGVAQREEGEFYGYSALIMGFAKLIGMEAVCLFGETIPDSDNPEHPDSDAAKRVLDMLKLILKIELDTSELVEKAEERRIPDYYV